MQLIDSDRVMKRVGRTTVLRDISFQLNEGERVALTGKNGSGKSSLLKWIGGLYEETSGHVERQLVIVGYVPEMFPETVRATPRQFLRAMGRLSNRSSRQTYVRMIETYADAFGLADVLDRPLKRCSKGTRQKVGIIQALLHEPDILLLDEPLTGLDEEGKRQLVRIIEQLPKRVAVVFVTHDRSFIESVATRVVTIADGTIVKDQVVSPSASYQTIAVSISDAQQLDGISYVHGLFVSEERVELTVERDEVDDVLLELLTRGCSIHSVTEKETL